MDEKWKAKLPEREELLRRLKNSPLVDEGMHEPLLAHAGEERSAFGIVLDIVYAAHVVVRRPNMVSFIVRSDGPNILKLMIDDPDVRECAKQLIRQEFGEPHS